MATTLAQPASTAPGTPAEPSIVEPTEVPPAPENLETPPPLLREGGFLLEAKGTLHHDADTDRWNFRLAPEDADDPVHELTLLPCTLLANLQQLIESMPQREITFDLTGQVFVYRRRNYLLPTHAPRLVDYVAPSRPPDDAGPPGRDDDSADSILRHLDRAVGPVVRSPRATADTPARTASGKRAMLPPGTVIVRRRGWMVRTPGGAWTFVFGSDASGLDDPPMILLPTLLLQDMERHAQRSGPASPLLLSGRVYRYHGRNYLLPTMYQIPRNHTTLRP